MTRFDRPWRNPLGELLCSIYMRLVRPEPDEHDPIYPDQPVSTTPLNKFCKQCKTGTLHEEQVWVVEEITTYECKECGSLWTTD